MMKARAILLGAASAGVMVIASAAHAADSAPAAPASTNTTVGEVIVTARRLDTARATIQPQLGASTYAITNQAIQAMPAGDNAGLNQVVLQAPGVAQDSYGQLHIRGEHNGVQYRINGVILPEGLSVFGQALSPRLADRVTLITGALPAQYGLRTAGIIDITTKSGIQSGGSVSVYGGSHGEIEPSLEYAGHAGDTNLFVSTSYLTDQLGIESPDGKSTPLHDRTDQFQGFAYLDKIINPDTRVSLVLGTSDERFQIPDLSGEQPGLTFGPNANPALNPQLAVNGQTTYPSADLNENQTEVTHYGAVSLLHTADKLTTQVSLFGRYSDLTFTPDVQGDLLYDGLAQSADKTDVAGGLQAEGVYTLNDAHTLRGGVIVEVDRSTSQTTSEVIPISPVTHLQTSETPTVIAENAANTAQTYSAYHQGLTLNYGLRFDQFDGFRDENQLSPRVNLVWIPVPGTTFHAGYSRYFSPPPFELVGGETVSKFNNTTAASLVTTDTTPYSERANYYDVGAEQRVNRALTVGIDSYYKTSTNLIDEGQFGAPIILTPFNYAQGVQYGVELTSSLNVGHFSAYANAAWSQAKGKDIVSSQFNFNPQELAYIADHFIYLDHNQTYSASMGASYRCGDSRFSGDLIYGSGLRADLDLPGGGAIPNGKSLTPYTQVNLSASHKFETAPGGPIEIRVDFLNALDDKYEIRDGTGVGVGAPQFGPRRGVFAGFTKDF
jgi:outer membrane receptor for ferrienterochelin and colicins